jgi:hypothetical protein
MRGWWLVVLVACSHSPSSAPSPDAAALRESPAFTMLLCTSGQPGDPTCPLNDVDVTCVPGLPATYLQFVAEPLGMDIHITHAMVNSAGDIDEMELEQPCGSPVPGWEAVDTSAAGNVALPDVVVHGEMVCIGYHVVGG